MTLEKLEARVKQSRRPPLEAAENFRPTPEVPTSLQSPEKGATPGLHQVDAVINALSDGKSGEQRLEELRQTRIASVEHQAGISW